MGLSTTHTMVYILKLITGSYALYQKALQIILHYQFHCLRSRNFEESFWQWHNNSIYMSLNVLGVVKGKLVRVSMIFLNLM